MSDTGKREELIQKIADALHADDVKRGRVFVPRAEVDAETAAWYLDNACAAVNVFEQAHTPTDDEREALARAQWDDPANVITWDALTEKAERDEGDYREVRDYALAAAGRGVAAGFRRTAVPESSAECQAWHHFQPGCTCQEPQGKPADDELEALRGEAERVRRAALAEIHGQDAGRKYSVAEVKRMVYSFDNVLSSLLRRTAVQEPSDDTGCPHEACEIDSAGNSVRCADCGDDLQAVPEPQGEPTVKFIPGSNDDMGICRQCARDVLDGEKPCAASFTATRDALIEGAKLDARNSMRSDPRVWHEALEAALDKVLPPFWDAALRAAAGIGQEEKR